MNLIQKTCEQIQPSCIKTREKVKERLDQLVMPKWALGRVMDLAWDLAGQTGRFNPKTERKTLILAAADHGIVEEGVSLYPQEVTSQMVRNFVTGKASVNVFAKLQGVRVIVMDVGVAFPITDVEESAHFISTPVAQGTRNFLKNPAMSREQAMRSIELGIEKAFELADSTDVFSIGEMGIGNTTASSAIASAITGLSAMETTGKGSGISESMKIHKQKIIEKVLDLHKPDKGDAIDILAKVGGFEIGTLSGVILASAAKRKPVVIDGFIATASALIANLLKPEATEYLIASHLSAERGHSIMLRHLAKRPLLDLEMRLGEGTGAVLAMPIIDAAARILTEIPTFSEVGVLRATH